MIRDLFVVEFQAPIDWGDAATAVNISYYEKVLMVPFRQTL